MTRMGRGLISSDDSLAPAAIAAAAVNEFGNFLGPWTGAVARTLLDRLSETLSVKDFGAVCDGATDDSDALTAAIAAVDDTTGGGIIIPGPCAVHNITVKKGLRLFGLNKGSTGGLGLSRLINNSTAGEPTLTLTSASGVWGLEIEHLAFTLGAGATAGDFVDLQNCVQAHIHHCHFQGWTANTSALHLDSCRYSTIASNQFYGANGDTDRIGLELTDGTGDGNAENIIHDNYFSVMFKGIVNDTGSHNIFVWNGFEDGTVAPAAAPMKWGIFVNGGAQNILRENRFELRLNDADSACVELDDTSRNVVIDNHMSHVQHGVILAVPAGAAAFNRIIRGTYPVGSRPVWIKAGVTDTLIDHIIPNYSAAGADVLDSGTRTIRIRSDSGFGTSLAGTGIPQWNAITAYLPLDNAAAVPTRTLKQFCFCRSMADDTSVTLPAVTTSGYGVVVAGDDAQHTQFTVNSTGTVTLINNTADVVANADTDTKLCIGTAGAQEPLLLKNRLGGAAVLNIMFWYD